MPRQDSSQEKGGERVSISSFSILLLQRETGPHPETFCLSYDVWVVLSLCLYESGEILYCCIGLLADLLQTTVKKVTRVFWSILSYTAHLLVVAAQLTD
jgi:hypothetical protein